MVANAAICCNVNILDFVYDPIVPHHTLTHMTLHRYGDGVYPIMSMDYVSFSIIHCLARLVFLHSFIPSSVVDYLSNSPFDSYHHLSPNNSQDEASL